MVLCRYKIYHLLRKEFRKKLSVDYGTVYDLREQNITPSSNLTQKYKRKHKTGKD